MFEWMRRGVRRAILAVASGLLAGPLIVPAPEAGAADVRARSMCTYHTVHVDTRLRVRADAYVGAPIIGHLYPGQRARGGCWPMWSVDRYWVRLVEPFEGYAAAYYLRNSALTYWTSGAATR